MQRSLTDGVLDLDGGRGRGGFPRPRLVDRRHPKLELVSLEQFGARVLGALDWGAGEFDPAGVVGGAALHGVAYDGATPVVGGGGPGEACRVVCDVMNLDAARGLGFS